MKAKKLFALLLAALMTSTSLIACGDGAAETTAETAAANEAGETEAAVGETTREQIDDNLPEKDFGGRNFHLLTRQNYFHKFMPEDMTGEAVNDALYTRNTKIMELYNITMEYTAPACEWGSSSKTWNQDL